MLSQLDLFQQVFNLVQRNYVEQPDTPKLIKGAIDGMLKTLDPHSVYLPAQRAQQMDEQFHGEYSGIGVSFDIQDNKIVVLSPLEGTPAFRLGIRAGDRTVMEEGMTFHCIPAIWLDTYGIVISESFAVGRNGAECFADYPRVLFAKH